MAISILNRYTGAVIVTLAVSTLVGFDFGGLNLTNADLSGKDLTNAKFGGANVTGSTFQNSNLTGTSFQKSNVQGSDFRGVTKDATSNFHQCYFEDVVLDLADQNYLNWFFPNLLSGQSNAQSVSNGPTTGLPDASIPFFFANFSGGTSGGLWGSLQIDPVTTDHGSEILFCQTLKALGWDIGSCKITQGATTMTDWTPPAGPQWTSILLPNLMTALSQLQTIRPGKFSRWSFNWALGEDDSRALGLGATQYGLNLLTLLIGLSGIIANRIWKWFIPARTQSWLANNVPNSLSDCRRWESQLSTGGTSFINTDAFARNGDNVHYSAAGQDTFGQAQAVVWQAIVPTSPP